MSATLDSGLFSDYFGGCPVLHAQASSSAATSRGPGLCPPDLPSHSKSLEPLVGCLPLNHRPPCRRLCPRLAHPRTPSEAEPPQPGRESPSFLGAVSALCRAAPSRWSSSSWRTATRPRVGRCRACRLPGVVTLRPLLQAACCALPAAPKLVRRASMLTSRCPTHLRHIPQALARPPVSMTPPLLAPPVRCRLRAGRRLARRAAPAVGPPRAAPRRADRGRQEPARGAGGVGRRAGGRGPAQPALQRGGAGGVQVGGRGGKMAAVAVFSSALPLPASGWAQAPHSRPQPEGPKGSPARKAVHKVAQRSMPTIRYPASPRGPRLSCCPPACAPCVLRALVHAARRCDA